MKRGQEKYFVKLTGNFIMINNLLKINFIYSNVF